ncbi:ABC transporter ATP-binding protein [Nesterenkonia rhizosphaerae]|uniref:ABC transporter ATP-binding protein n=1 Tax=Nesterenkonia rhizosphaerae TaxID=1348272 RepID=A0ABP9FVC1_9MICC
MLSVDGVSLTYPDGDSTLTVLEEVAFKVAPGLAVIVGPSGTGKSSLLRIIAGLQQPLSGEVLIDNADLPGGIAGAMYVPQDFQLIPFLSAADNVRLAAEVHGSPEPNVESLLQTVGLKGLAERKPEELSGGQQQRLALARALSVNTPILLPDEPTGSLDEATSIEIAHLLHEVAHKNKKVVFAATHDPALIAEADSVFELRSAKVKRTR